MKNIDILAKEFPTGLKIEDIGFLFEEIGNGFDVGILYYSPLKAISKESAKTKIRDYARRELYNKNKNSTLMNKSYLYFTRKLDSTVLEFI